MVRTAPKSATSPWRRRGAVLRGLLTAIVFVAVSAVSPGIAAASYGTVSPLLDCATQNSDGTYTAVLGYTNTTGAKATIPYGYLNSFSPSKYNGAQPTTFLTGTQHGVFAVKISAYDAYYSNPTWTLNGNTLAWSYNTTLSASCPAPTQLPAQGNDTGAVVALLVAGGIGVLVLLRVRRRAMRADADRTPTPV